MRIPIYEALAAHQQTEQWRHRELMADLRRWAELIVIEFKLDVPPLALRVDRIGSHCYGHFRPGHNGFGLAKEIAINETYLATREYWRVIGTLCHEIIHAWQDKRGTASRGHHNAEFRAKALEYGLLVDRRGFTEYVDGPFTELLRRHSLTVPQGLGPVPTHRVAAAGSSKLKKWSCGCEKPFNARVARADFRALCLYCRCEFRLGG